MAGREKNFACERRCKRDVQRKIIEQGEGKLLRSVTDNVTTRVAFA